MDLYTEKPDFWQGPGLQKGIFNEHNENRWIAGEIADTHMFLANREQPPSLHELIQLSKYAAWCCYQIGAPNYRARSGAWTGTVICESLPEKPPTTQVEQKIYDRFMKGEPETHFSWSEWLDVEQAISGFRSTFWSCLGVFTVEQYHTMKREERIAKALVEGPKS